jgi:hypothetical protein
MGGKERRAMNGLFLKRHIPRDMSIFKNLENLVTHKLRLEAKTQ